MINDKYPRLERGPSIEVPRSRNGRPGYAWVQGWVVLYSEKRQSIPYRLNDARDLLRKAKS